MGLLKPHRLAMKAARHEHKASKRKKQQQTPSARARTISANRHRS